MSDTESGRRFPACILGTVVVPWRDDDSLDEARFRHAIVTLLEAGYSHLYVFGTAGEGHSVDDDQFERITRVFADEMRAGRAEPMVGVISLSQGTIKRRIAWARDTLGVRLFQVSLPSWGALEDLEVRRFFDDILGQFEDCQFLHYNLLRAKRLVAAQEYGAIGADHPNLVATKNGTDSMLRVRELLEQAPTLQHFLGEHGFLFGSLIDECGLLISVATSNLEMGRRYFEGGRRRDVDTLVRLDGELAEIGRSLVTIINNGVPSIDSAYDKVLWWLHDRRFPLRLLPPYRGAEPEAAERFLRFLREHYAHWAPA